MTQHTRRDVREFKKQYRALLATGDLPAFEALLDQYAAHFSVTQRRQFVEQFTHDAANALRHQWRFSK
jgi:hypothetical protein